jgi:MmoB/DmpM family
MPVMEVDEFTATDEHHLVGPIMRNGPLAEAMIDAIADDNPGSDVFVLDRDDYIRIHTTKECMLSRDTLIRHLGQDISLAQIEVQMPSFKGRLETRTHYIRWYYES